MVANRLSRYAEIGMGTSALEQGGRGPLSWRPLAMAGEAISNCWGCPPCDEQDVPGSVCMVTAVEQIRIDEYEFLRQGTTSTFKK